MQKIYTDGSTDSSRNGRFAWYNEATNETWLGHEKNITHNQAEYLAVYHALKNIKEKDVEILSDSELVVKQMTGKDKIKDKKMKDLSDRVRELIKNKGLNVEFVWVRRNKNKAGKYLERLQRLAK